MLSNEAIIVDNYDKPLYLIELSKIPQAALKYTFYTNGRIVQLNEYRRKKVQAKIVIASTKGKIKESTQSLETKNISKIKRDIRSEKTAVTQNYKLLYNGKLEAINTNHNCDPFSLVRSFKSIDSDLNKTLANNESMIIPNENHFSRNDYEFVTTVNELPDHKSNTPLLCFDKAIQKYEQMFCARIFFDKENEEYNANFIVGKALAETNLQNTFNNLLVKNYKGPFNCPESSENNTAIKYIPKLMGKYF